jgi:hypothetical protein
MAAVSSTAARESIPRAVNGMSGSTSAIGTRSVVAMIRARRDVNSLRADSAVAVMNEHSRDERDLHGVDPRARGDRAALAESIDGSQ